MAKDMRRTNAEYAVSPKYKLGPAMAALSPRRRSFVVAMVETGGNSYTDCARFAGYDHETDNSLRVTAHRLAHDPKVLLAIKEETEKRLKSGAPIGMAAVIEIAGDKFHKDRLKAATRLLDQAGLNVAQEYNVRHEHTLELKNDPERIQRIMLLAAQMGSKGEQLIKSYGLDMKQLEAMKTVSMPPVIEAEYAEVEAKGSMEGLEDLL